MKLSKKMRTHTNLNCNHMRTTNKQATTTKIVRTNVEYVTLRKEGFYDIVAKYVDGIIVKEIKVPNYFR
jgi:hypothetical protein